eukprot:7514797-Ditylum_brightwellii.AAC.1
MDKSKDNKDDQINIEKLVVMILVMMMKTMKNSFPSFGVKISYQIVKVGIWIGLDIRKCCNLEI